ncbi:glucuronate isomerase [Kineosporia babensis]|uniref:Uronate isomerase n=1 Tax=Kineosporia babensis TaxID=499548 RepID=A0A9X1T274_9ACTN|nr:glucuronate isomerase [Kineosporia babensis]MCD5314323.1 glucuronate isomerase [Kineosporia babensis]
MSELDPDRLFPADPGTRELARELYALVSGLPILSPHGHVDPDLIRLDQPFGDPAALLVTPDHYVTRLLHASGVPLEQLGVATEGADPREIWRAFCSHQTAFVGTASGYWLQHELGELFGIFDELSAENADSTFDLISAALARDDFRPRALFQRFGIEVLATTDDPLDDLSAHAALAADPGFAGRVLPTFRPDAYIDPAHRGFRSAAERLAEASGTSVDNYEGYLDGLAARREHFVRHGAVSADFGVRTPLTVDLPGAEAAALYKRAVRGELSFAEAEVFRGHMLLESARMSVADGLVMTLHPGVFRDHHGPTWDRFGPDTGHDIPLASEFTQNLRPLLQRFGTAPDFHLVLFTLDETTYGREIAPLAGFYPSLFVGAPWWFLDAPDSILRARAATTESAGLTRGSGFIDDTRAFLSIPARHDMARRLEASYLARLVREGRTSISTARRLVVDLIDAQPRKVFKL